MASSSSATAQAASLLLQTPPGQTSKVYHDLRALLESNGQANASAELKKHAEPILEQYNTDQLITVRPPAAEGAAAAEGESRPPVIVARAGEIPGEAGRYADPRAQLSYAFDHLRLAASDPKPLRANKSFEVVRAAIDAKVSKYVKDHYQDGVTSTFTVIKPDPTKVSEAAKAAAGVGQEEVAHDDSEGAAKAKREEAVEEAAKDPAVSTAVEGTLEAAEQESAKPTEGDAGEAKAGGEDEEKDDAVEAVKAVEEVEKDRADAGAEAVKDEPEELPEPQGEPTYVTHIVGNRYNLANFWAGRWRSSYAYTPSASGPATLSSSIQVQVHYFEDGNVQLAASHPQDIELDLSNNIGSSSQAPSAEDAEKIAQVIAVAIKKYEQEYHAKLNERYTELSEKAFKAMRRQLPVTKQKLDWDKAISYKLGSQLSK